MGRKTVKFLKSMNNKIVNKFKIKVFKPGWGSWRPRTWGSAWGWSRRVGGLKLPESILGSSSSSGWRWRGRPRTRPSRTCGVDCSKEKIKLDQNFKDSVFTGIQICYSLISQEGKINSNFHNSKMAFYLLKKTITIQVVKITCLFLVFGLVNYCLVRIFYDRKLFVFNVKHN